MSLPLEQLTKKVTEACRQADQQIIQPIRQQADLQVKNKDNSGRNFVTQADLDTEKFLKQTLNDILPGCGFIAEESFDGSITKELNWIIDPIDGTTNFMHNMPPFCISVALAFENDVQLGVIYDLFSKEVFYAWQGGGAWLNGKPITVSKTNTLRESLLVTGFPYEQGTHFDQWLSLFGNFLTKAQNVRRLGSAAIDMAYVAAGRFEAFYEYNLSPWDVAAGCIIVQEAGGKLSDFDGGSNYLFGKQIVCSNGMIHEQVLSELNRFFR